MKHLYFLLAIALAGCNSTEQQKGTTDNRDSVNVQREPTKKTKTEEPKVSLPAAKTYANKRFKEVTVEKIGEHTFQIQGQAQIFEASFNWVVEDGHRELKEGFAMTDAGAPAWGKFKFTIDVQKERANSTLMLILFESSPKDGSRQYELPVVLY